MKFATVALVSSAAASTWHADGPHGKGCFQISGHLMDDANVVKAVDEKLAEHHMHLSRGTCASAGFDTQYKGWEKHAHGLTMTVWYNAHHDEVQADGMPNCPGSQQATISHDGHWICTPHGECGMDMHRVGKGAMWHCAKGMPTCHGDDVPTATPTGAWACTAPGHCVKGMHFEGNIHGNWSCSPDGEAEEGMPDCPGSQQATISHDGHWICTPHGECGMDMHRVGKGAMWHCAKGMPTCHGDDVPTATPTGAWACTAPGHCVKGMHFEGNIHGNWSCSPDGEAEEGMPDCPGSQQATISHDGHWICTPHGECGFDMHRVGKGAMWHCAKGMPHCHGDDVPTATQTGGWACTAPGHCSKGMHFEGNIHGNWSCEPNH